jgi:hypothetical protein
MSIPLNASDAISAVRDGVLGLVETVLIGELEVSALIELDAPEELDISEKPIEEGYNIVYAAIHIPIEINMTICLANPQYSVENAVGSLISGDVSSLTETWRDKKDRLYTYKNDREILTVQTQDGTFENMLIKNITPIYNVDENWDAFFASVTLRQVEILTSTTSDNGSLSAQGLKDMGGL